MRHAQGGPVFSKEIEARVRHSGLSRSKFGLIRLINEPHLDAVYFLSYRNWGETSHHSEYMAWIECLGATDRKLKSGERRLTLTAPNAFIRTLGARLLPAANQVRSEDS